MGTLIRAAAIEQGARDLGTLRKMKDFFYNRKDIV